MATQRGELGLWVGGWAGDTLSDCLSLSSLSAWPGPAPKPVPLGDESGESPSLKMPFQGSQGVEGGEGRALRACAVPLVSQEGPRGRV